MGGNIYSLFLGLFGRIGTISQTGKVRKGAGHALSQFRAIKCRQVMNFFILPAFPVWFANVRFSIDSRSVEMNGGGWCIVNIFVRLIAVVRAVG